MSRIARTDEQIELIQTGPFADAVSLEMVLQDGHWGPAVGSGNTWAQWHLILDREMGEAAAEFGALEWGEWTPERLKALRFELVQVVAVATQVAKVIHAEIERQNA